MSESKHESSPFESQRSHGPDTETIDYSVVHYRVLSSSHSHCFCTRTIRHAQTFFSFLLPYLHLSPTNASHFPHLPPYPIRESPMSRTHQWSLTPSISSQGSAPSSSKFTEHLSIAVPPPNSAFERSRFSPDSPTRHAFPLGRHIFHRSSPRSQRFDPEKGAAIVSIPSSQSSQPSIRDRLARLFSVLRVSRRNDSSVQRVAPIVVAPPSDVPVWRLGHVPESDTQHARNVHPRPTRTQERYSPALLFAFMIFLLYLFINVIVLNIRSFSPSHSSLRILPTTSPASAPTDPIMISADAQQCLTQYTLNAPNNPEGYPCSTCLPLLNAVPTNSSPVYPVARDATQFCGLRSIWEDAGQQGQAGLEAGGWVKDVKFCTWSGVRCNGAGRVSSLYVLSSSSQFSPTEFNRVFLHVDN